MNTFATLKATSQVVFASSILLFVLGMGLTTVFAPCYGPGALVTEAALLLSLVAIVLFVIRAFKRRDGWVWVIGSGMAACAMLFFGFVWTLLLCRGV